MHGDSIGRMRLVEARYDRGVLTPTEPLALRPGERVKLIVLRGVDEKRWNLARLAKGGSADEHELTEQGLAEWATELDEEDRH